MNTRFVRPIRPVLIAFFVGSLILAACSGRPVLPANISLAQPRVQRTMDPVFLTGSPIPDAQIDANIDPNLPQDERKELHDTMLLLPPDRRRNLTIYKLDGRIFATRPELTARVVTYTLIPGSQNSYRDKNGDTITGPPLDSRAGIQPMNANSSTDCNSGTNSGAFRRVCSVSGYAGEDVEITPLPCAAGSMVIGDTPYLLLGGWSPNEIAVDSGLQYSPTNDWYTPFFRRQGGMQMNLQGNLPCWNGYNGPNQPEGVSELSLTFLSSTQIVVFADFLEDNPDGTSLSVSWSQEYDVPRSDGWTTSGSGEIWKRATAIAQSTPAPNVSCPCYDGSYFGWSSTNSEMFYWNNAQLGTYAKSGGYVSYTWSPWATYSGTGGYLTNPNDPNAVFVNFIDSRDEYDGINLCNTC